MKVKPSAVTQPWGLQQKRVQGLLSAIGSRQVGSLGDLLDVWTRDPLYLLAETLPWFPEEMAEFFKSYWPPVDSKGLWKAEWVASAKE